MKILSNAHTHTNFCDGANTPLEMAQRAVELGFTDLGFSGHSPAPFDEFCPGVQDEAAYIDTVRGLQGQFAGVLGILCGIEQDYDAPVQNPALYDYILGSVHYLEGEGGAHIAVDGTPQHVLHVRDTLFDGNGLAFASAFFEKSLLNVKTYTPHIVGHWDLIVKHNQNHRLFDADAPAYRDIALQAADELANLVLGYGGIVEVNTGGISRGYTQVPYPAPFILYHLAQRGVPVTISSDSHAKHTLNSGFGQAVHAVYNAGYRELVVLQGGAFVPQKIEL